MNHAELQPKIETELNCWMHMLIFWQSLRSDRGSFVLRLVSLPSSCKNSRASFLIDPDYSTAIAMKTCNWHRSEYKIRLLEAARLARRPTPQQAVEMLVGVKVSWHVTSHTRQRPCAQGMMEILSGHLPSPLPRPWGFSVQGMSTATKAPLMMSVEPELNPQSLGASSWWVHVVGRMWEGVLLGPWR